jgi:hypothetical protein
MRIVSVRFDFGFDFGISLLGRTSHNFYQSSNVK